MEKLIRSKNYKDIFRVARLFYRFGNPMLPDRLYDSIQRHLENHAPDFELLHQTYDDDDLEEAFAICRKYDIDIPPEMEAQTITDREAKYLPLFGEEPSKSIKAVETYKKAYELFNKVSGNNLIMSLKVDGINTRGILEKYNLEYFSVFSTTRSREGSGFDLTDSMRKVLKSHYNLPSNNKHLFMFAEAYSPKKSLPFLRAKYRKDFVTPRSTAMSMLRVEYDAEDYKHLRVMLFKISGLADSLSESLKIAEESGFNVVPHLTVTKDEVPKDFDVFEDWLREKLNWFWEVSQKEDIASDGVVVEIDNQVAFSMQGEKAQYNLGNFALKLDKWCPCVYQSVVKDIIWAGNKDRYSVVAEIEPVVTLGGNVATRVNLFNGDIMIKNNIRKGYPITFEYKSENAINLRYIYE